MKGPEYNPQVKKVGETHVVHSTAGAFAFWQTPEGLFDQMDILERVALLETEVQE